MPLEAQTDADVESYPQGCYQATLLCCAVVCLSDAQQLLPFGNPGGGAALPSRRRGQQQKLTACRRSWTWGTSPRAEALRTYIVHTCVCVCVCVLRSCVCVCVRANGCSVCAKVLQCVAVCCCVLQCVAVSRTWVLTAAVGRAKSWRDGGSRAHIHTIDREIDRQIDR